MAQLVLHGSAPRVHRLRSGDALTVGRSPDNAIVLDDPEVSRHHCRVEAVEQGHRVVDLGSSNGTFLNGRCVRSMVLEFRDQLVVGQQVLTYLDDGDDPFASRPPLGVSQLPWPDAHELGDSDTRLTMPRVRTNTTRIFLRPAEQRDLRRQEILLRVGLLGHGVSTHFELCRLMDAILDELLDFTGHRRGLLLLYDDATSQLLPVAGRSSARVPLPNEAWSYRRDLVEDALADRAPRGDDAGALCLPLVASARLNFQERRGARPRERCLGAFYLDQGTGFRPEEEQDAWLLEALASHAASALRNARLHHVATTDGLTRLHNRTFLHGLLRDELATEPRLAVLLVDLDHFKRVNDEHGHATGDEVLARAAQRIQSVLRRDDTVGRWGGEEFLVLLPGTDRAGAVEVARKIGEALSSRPIGGPRLQVTASIGIALRPDHGEDADTLLLRADTALYAAKEAGRCRSVVYDPEHDAGRTPLGAGC